MNLTQEDQDDLCLAISEYCEEYMEANAINLSKPWFHDEFLHEMFNYIQNHRIWYFDVLSRVLPEAEVSDSEDDESESDIWFEFVVHVCKQLWEMFEIPERQQLMIEEELNENEAKIISEILIRLNAVPVQKQRSAEWHEKRHDQFSASNLYKLFGSAAQINSIIYEKCKPPSVAVEGMGKMNGDTRNPMNWGIKYEQLSLMIYEEKFSTKVKSDYGCIPHANSSMHVGASPDAINVDPANLTKFGTLVEVKNIVNREIDGIPCEQYWVQMQIQMEVCDLQKCDYLETRFKEFETESAFLESDKEYKGIIYLLIPREGIVLNPKYVYVPLRCPDLERFIEETQEANPQFILYDKTYWYLDEFSCILVKRNVLWFQAAIPILQREWAVVEKERKDGYEHRAPKQRKPKVLLEGDPLYSPVDINLNRVLIIKLDENGNPV
jgi:hypothetical protein